MKTLIEGFIKEQNQRELLRNNTTDNLEKETNLEEDFQDYIFKVFFYGYIKKSINFSAMENRRKHNKIKNHEELSLNVVDENFNEEKINLIIGNETQKEDQLEILWQEEERFCLLEEISHNIEIVKAIGSLTKRQKEVIYHCIILGEGDTQVGKKLGITKQAVNKIKKAALEKLRKQLVERDWGA
ncbi:sigma factor-like helix-turn-helix DNA-binding protein [Alkaliphilus transvaalensis]|uniref:sigma factor-like helix-turn-helix DNA-binding protein n=1 Tax=Alkaliphilus transvaalensis TaxID=114628 RepID=UPI00047C1A42|nr:sigma factor-like helix-turn-helix DNA-binding protein [Alkaliphilus transvaalensis]